MGAIYGSNRAYPVGGIVLPVGSIVDEFRVAHPPQPIHILREATWEEYRDECLLFGYHSPPHKDGDHYYEVSFD